MPLGAASGKSRTEVEILIGRGGFTAYQPQPNSECRAVFPGSEAAGANVHGREGKNPDHRLRSRSVC